MRDTKHSDLAKIDSQDGHRYYQREIPEDGSGLQIKFNPIDEKLDIDLDTVDGYPVHHLYLDCKEITNVGLPLEADPRKPEKSRQVEAMVETLEEQPDDFVKFNNGIVILCENVEETSSGVEMSFRSREGICNGGHTYFSFFEADSVDGAAVHIEAIEIPEDDFETNKKREQKITEIAQARNNNNQLDRRSIANFLGYFNEFKNSLWDDRVVEWNEGDPRAYKNDFDSVDFIRLLKTWDVKIYRHPIYNKKGSNHQNLAVSRGKVLNSWEKKVREAREEETQRPLIYLVPLTNDLMWIRDFIAYELKSGDLPQGVRSTKFFQEYVTNEDDTRDLSYLRKEGQGITLPRPLEVLFVGSFRTNIYLSESPYEFPRYVGWFMDFESLWERRITQVLNDLNDEYKSLETPKRQFKRLNGPFNHDFYQLMVGKTPEPPYLIYDRKKISPDSSEGTFIKDDSGSYWLERHEDTADQLHDSKTNKPPDEDVPHYSEREPGIFPE